MMSVVPLGRMRGEGFTREGIHWPSVKFIRVALRGAHGKGPASAAVREGAKWKTEVAFAEGWT